MNGRTKLRRFDLKGKANTKYSCPKEKKGKGKKGEKKVNGRIELQRGDAKREGFYKIIVSR